MEIRKNSKDEDAYDTTSGSQLWFCLPVYWVYILNVFLLSPSGTTKNRKTFKKWNQFSRGGLFFRVKI